MTDDLHPGEPKPLAAVIAVVLAAALGAAFGDLLLTAIVAGLSDPSGLIALAVAAPLMYLASRHFLDPFSDGIRNVLRLPAAQAASDAPTGRGLWALAVGSAVLFIWAANVLGDYAQSHPDTVVATILVSVFVVGSITLGWIIGARAALPLSGVLGALAGFAANTAATIAVLAWAGVPVTGEAVTASAASGLSVGLSGLAGGLVIDMGSLRRPSVGATAAALLMFAVTGLAGAWLSGNFNAGYILPNVMLGLGWLLGLSSSPSADTLLRRKAVERQAVA
ncbi:hypothetical protein [Hyphomicrobium sp.]|uniref:hypothetical protein n=1 Tax=Hyphomicrobium sp. TaxID=82 RepID=UPI0025C5C837|nr:hypothetical protein [Hyphomicrobium sp.]MCC7252180.1 hypothetical protein [Hyphomicrobium sp.]